MPNTEMLLHEAIALGEEEMALLKDRDVKRAGTLARERGKLVKKLFAMRASDEMLRSKLMQLQEQQGQLTNKAKDLHCLLKQELLATKGQTKRYSGYRNATKITPISSRFMNKRG